MKRKRVVVSVPVDIYDQLKKRATEERATLSGLTGAMVSKWVQQGFSLAAVELPVRSGRALRQ